MLSPWSTRKADPTLRALAWRPHDRFFLQHVFDSLSPEKSMCAYVERSESQAAFVGILVAGHVSMILAVVAGKKGALEKSYTLAHYAFFFAYFMPF